MNFKNTNLFLDPELWVDQYGDYLYHFALSRLRNSTDAQNAVQETFLAGLKAKDKFAGKSTERTWLIGILKHKIIDIMRKNYKEKPVTNILKENEAIDQFFDNAQHMKEQPKDWNLNPKEVLEKKEFWKVFNRCQEKLSQTARDAFTLKEIDKLKGKEICKILNITPANFWILMHRARLQLRQCLEINWFTAEKKCKD